LRIPSGISGAAPVRTRPPSSPRLRSRTPCSRFAIPQGAHAIASRRGAVAGFGSKLVIAQTVSGHAWPWTRRPGSIRPTGWAPGQLRYPVSRVVVVSRRIATRPWPCSQLGAGRLGWPAAAAPEGEKAGRNAPRMSAARVGWLSLTVTK
jgi:hypothetical protein